jgi:hypothetical protein
MTGGADDTERFLLLDLYDPAVWQDLGWKINLSSHIALPQLGRFSAANRLASIGM